MMEELETWEVYCGSDCGHFDSLNQCCWLSWWIKHEGDWCDYGLRITAEREIYTPNELKELRSYTEKANEGKNNE